MANSKIHEYTDSATLSDVQNLPVLIDCEVEEIGGWTSKKLDVKNIIDASNDTMQRIFGQYHDTTTQVHTVVNSAKAMELNSIVFNNGMSLVNDAFGKPTILRVASAGIYNLQFSAQLSRNAGNNSVVINIWLAKEGLAVPFSNTRLTLTGTDDAAKAVAAWNFFVTMNAGQYLQLMWTVSDLDLIIESFAAATPAPEIPSLILTLSQVG